MRWIKSILISTGIALIAIAVLPVSQGASPARPADDVAREAFVILEQNCANAGCHGGPGYYSFDVRDVSTLKDAKVIQTGNATDSELIRRLEAGAMPLGGYKGQPGVKLPAAEIAMLRRWIDAGAPAFSKPTPETRPFLSERDVLAAVVRDLEAASEWDRPFLRYFSIANLWNESGIPQSELGLYPVALSKLLNHLSWERSITQPRQIDLQKTLLRIDLRDYGWTNQTWSQILDAYPYGVADGEQSSNVDRIRDLSGSGLPYVRADWFLAAASVAPLYHQILRLPGTLSGLENLLRIDSASDVERGRARRFGLRNSGVSRHNRAIERTPTVFGAYWKSFDFANSRLEQNIFVDPIHLQPDGGEMIFSLPNGLHAYFIVNKTGTRIDDAPVNIVRDRTNADDPVVRNGRSCISCHTRGINAFRDEISATLTARIDAAFDLSRAKALYRGQEELDRLVDEDNRIFSTAILRAAGDRAGDGSEEPITRLARRYESALTVAQAAADVFMEATALQRIIANSPRLQRQGFDQLLGAKGGIKRDTWEQDFDLLLRELEPRISRASFPASLSSSLVLNTSQGPGATYRNGDDVGISFMTSTERFVGLFRVDSRGNILRLYPSEDIPQTPAVANRVVRLDSAGKSVTKAGQTYGVETLIGVAATNPIPLEHDPGWEAFARSLRTWASSTSLAPKESAGHDVAILRYFTAPGN